MHAEQDRVTHFNLPQSLTPFIGRQKELNDIQCRLQDPSCRLLTLLGPGGMGKTRLAVESVSYLDGFTDGIYFVDLLPVTTTAGLVTAVFQNQNNTIETVLPNTLKELTLPIPDVAPQSTHPQSPDLVEQLTPRELEVLQLIADGYTNRQIADELVISVGTAKYYTSQIYSKLHVANRTHAVARARELSLL